MKSADLKQPLFPENNYLYDNDFKAMIDRRQVLFELGWCNWGKTGTMPVRLQSGRTPPSGSTVWPVLEAADWRFIVRWFGHPLILRISLPARRASTVTYVDASVGGE